MKTLDAQVKSLRRQLALVVGMFAVLLMMGTVVLTTVVTINADGSAAVPVITMGTTPDPNTGIYHPAADTIGFAAGGVESVTIMNNDVTHGSMHVNDTGNVNALCITVNAAGTCDLATETGMFFDNSTIGVAAAGVPSSMFIYAQPLTIQTVAASIAIDDAQGAGTNTGAMTLTNLTLALGAGVTGSNSALQIQSSTVASSSPLVPFQIGPTTAFAAANIGMFKCTQRCTITRAWGLALTAGTVGSTASTVTVSDGSSTCTLTSGSGCNAATDTAEAFTTSGTCTFAAASTLTVVGNKGNCTVGPSFRNFGIEINNQ